MNVNFVKTESVGTFGTQSKFINLNQVSTVTITEEWDEPSMFAYELCPTAKPIKTGYTACIRMVGGEKISIKEPDMTKLLLSLMVIRLQKFGSICKPLYVSIDTIYGSERIIYPDGTIVEDN